MSDFEPNIRAGRLVKCHRGVSKLYNLKHSQYVVLTNFEIRWSNDEESDNACDYRGSCNLLNIGGVRISDSHPDRFIVYCGAQSVRTWRASSPKDADDWVEAIESAIVDVRQRASTEDDIDDFYIKAIEKVIPDGTSSIIQPSLEKKWGDSIIVGSVHSTEFLRCCLGDGGVVNITLPDIERKSALLPVISSSSSRPRNIQVKSSCTCLAQPQPVVSQQKVKSSGFSVPLYVGVGNTLLAYRAAQTAVVAIFFASIADSEVMRFLGHLILYDSIERPLFRVSYLSEKYVFTLIAYSVAIGSVIVLFDALSKQMNKEIVAEKEKKNHHHLGTITSSGSRNPEWTITLYRSDSATMSPPLSPGSSSIASSSTYDLNSTTRPMKSFTKNFAQSDFDDDLVIPLRFVRGCKGDMDEARDRYMQTLAWRKMENVDTILLEPQPHFDTIKQYYPHFYCGRARSGNLVYYERIGEVDMKAMQIHGIEMSEMLRYYTFQTEFLWKHLDNRDDDGKLVTVFDIAGCSFKDAFGDSLQFVKQASSTAQQHYPERCQMIIICNVPSWFNAIWKIVKAFLDPATLEKIKILKAGALFAELSQHVDSSCIPVEYGGTYEISQCNEALGYTSWNSAEEIQLRDYVKKLNSGSL